MIILIVCVFLSGQAQTESEYKEIDEKIIQFSSPINNEVVDGLIAFINNNFSTETDKLRAIAIWISNNFDYDIINIDTYEYYSETQEIITSMLKNKKGICAHFAELFSEIANKLGIKTYVISGYVKQHGLIANFPHVWCASFIDTAWFLTDPTWFTGHVENHEFIKKQSDWYFKATTENMIRSHMPFDPLWQFLYYPISPQEFYEGNTAICKENPFFNYVDTLKIYENSSKAEKLISTIRRIEQIGEGNILAPNQQHMIGEEKIAMKNQLSTVYYNSAVDFYNEGVNKLNWFIDQWNKKQMTQKKQAEVKNMIKSIEKTLINSQNELQKIDTTDINILRSTNEFQALLNKTFARVKDLNDFIDKHFTSQKR